MSDSLRPQRQSLPAFAPSIGLREVLESSPDLVFSIDPWGRLVWASSAFESFTGRRVKEAVGLSVLDMLAPQDAQGLVFAAARLLRRAAGTLDRVVHVPHADGSNVALEARVRVVVSSDGERYLVGVARRRWQDEATRSTNSVPAPAVATPANDVAVAEPTAKTDLLQARGDVLAAMGHEIRTPMNGVITLTNLLLQGELSNDARPMVETIQQRMQTLLGLIQDTLDYSSLEAGNMPVESLDFDLRVTLDQVAARLEPSAREHGVTFETRTAALVPSRVKGDPGRVRQVLTSLAQVAIEGTQAGAVQLLVDRETEDDHEVVLRFAVSDGAGSGASLGWTDSAGSGPAAPNGLGLALARRIVEAMGGMASFAADATGRTFGFRITLQKQPMTVGHAGAPAAEVALRGVRVLLADGNPADREPLADVLQAWGCNVTCAESGPEALRLVHDSAARGELFEVAILDRHLEMLDGEELGLAIRGDHDLDAMQLVMVTNVGRPGDGGRVKAAGFAAYLMKPLDPAQLYEALAEVLHPGHAHLAHDERPLVTRHSLAEARRGRLRLLLVDDDPVNQLVTTSALHRVGYNVEVVHSGRRAIERTEQERWDLILMDVQMPDLDGCRATAAIRARERGAWRTPIVGLSSSTDPGAERERGLASGMDLVLGKPIQLEELASVVERFTSRDGRPTESEPSTMPARLTVVSTHFEAPAAAETASKSAARTRSEGGPFVVPELPEGPAIDLEQLETACMGIPALRSSLLHTYLQDVRPRLDRLDQAFEAGDARRIEFESHGLKGMCATIGAPGCAVLFGEMEAWARDEHALEARILMGPARHEVERTEQFIQRLDSILMREDSDAA
ncbi:MAG: response regulator [Candidatus Eisenbacteria bacterium]|nr:response regulator [Candidatus Eisenbacteria bacterium]